jgi:hypothetical protein
VKVKESLQSFRSYVDKKNLPNQTLRLDRDDINRDDGNRDIMMMF